MNYSKNWIATYKSDLKKQALKALEIAKELESIKREKKLKKLNSNRRIC